MAVPAEQRITIGEIVAPHGVRGEVRVQPSTDIPGRFEHLAEVRLQWPDGREQVLPLERVRGHKQQAILKLAGCDTRSAAEALRGARLVVFPWEQPPLPPGEYYVHQILGLRVVTTTGVEVGQVTEVLFTGSNEVYVTPQVLIPATKELVREIDLAQGVMVIEPVPGLLDPQPDDTV